MRHGRVIYVLGDVHGDFGALNRFINKEIRQNNLLRAMMLSWREEGDDLQVMILQCGDFAWFWPGLNSENGIRNQIDFLDGGLISIYWTGGNHENWDQLDRLGCGIAEVGAGIYYCPFASTLEISPEIVVLFAGGAESADKDWRLEEMARDGVKIWWEQEGISEADMARLAFVSRADWVISHTAPGSFDVQAHLRPTRGSVGHLQGQSRAKLEQILMTYRPKRWFFGHFHHFMRGEVDGCQWEGLSPLGGGARAWDKIYVEWRT